jgi:hypothetical protein
VPNAWPFLLTKSPRLDYFTVLSPKLVIDAGLQRWFRNELNALAAVESSEITLKAVETPDHKKLTIYYKCEPARLEGVEIKDAHNRGFLRVYGILTDGTEGKEPISDAIKEAFSEAVNEIDRVFRELCQSTKEYESVASKSIPLPGEVIPMSKYPRGFAFVVAAGFTAIIIGFMALQYIQLRNEDKDLRRQVDSLTNQKGELARQIDSLTKRNEELARRLEELPRNHNNVAPPTPPPPSSKP